MSQAEVNPDPKFANFKLDEEKPTVDSAVDSLRAIAARLTWTSESDYPFEVLQLPDRINPPNTEELLHLTGHDADAFVEEISVENFFAPAIQSQDWHEEADKQRVQHFQTLLQWIEQHLSDVRVYRVGAIEIDVYILGKTESGAWINLATKVIET
jgi:Nuclease A inhibitor-like protein